jgi:WD40 repeat protein
LDIKKVWNYNAKEQVMGVAIGNLSQDQKSHILAFTKFGKVLIFSLFGDLLLGKTVTDKLAIWEGIIEDLDYDHKGEIILGGLDGLLRIFKCTEDFQLAPYWVHQFGSSISGILINDVNSDGIKEVIAYSLDKSIRVLNPQNGFLIWGQLFEEGVADAVICKSLQNDRNVEIIASSNDGTIRSFDPYKGDLLWFKRFDNKIRTISNVNVGRNNYIICGGDDKKLHVLDLERKEEIKTFKMIEYVWKCVSYPNIFNNNLLVSTYSFDFFDENIPIEDLEFKSEIIALDQNFNIKWKIKNVNAEKIDYIEVSNVKIVLIGSTKGELFLINELNGDILFQINHDSCINDFKYDKNSNLLITCHDNGDINAYHLFID